ncbi:MAG: hypothetical protein QJR03_08785 [Sphaerobacter sp.]|nr:hypothetical protein [Sphaerobacter sp.]
MPDHESIPGGAAEPGMYRLLDLRYGPGARQLAVTEALMGAVASGVSPPVLRLYSWAEPVVILGVSQPVADLDLDACRARDYRVLRRLSGGTAVYHDADEISVDLIVPPGTWFAPGDVTQAYARFSAVLGAALAGLGVAVRPVSVAEARGSPVPAVLRPACFGGLAPYELVRDGRKVVGLSQIRRRGVAVLQAALYRRFPAAALASALRVARDDAEAWAARLRQHAAGLDELTPSPPNLPEVAAAIRAAFAEVLPCALRESDVTPEEDAAVTRLVREKYAADDWSLRR